MVKRFIVDEISQVTKDSSFKKFTHQFYKKRKGNIMKNKFDKWIEEHKDEVNFSNADCVEMEIPDIVPLDKEILKNLQKTKFSRAELESLVDSFEDVQKQRIITGNQLWAMTKDGAFSNVENSILFWVYNNFCIMEKAIIKALDKYTDSVPIGRWLKSISGIGPTMAAKLIYYFDITKAEHYNQFHSYAGLNDNNRPWLGREKARELVERILDKNTPTLDMVRIISEKEGIPDSDKLESIKALVNDKVGDLKHYRVKILYDFLYDKKREEFFNDSETLEVVNKIINESLKSKLDFENYTIEVPKRKNKLITSYQLNLISAESQWPITTLEELSRDKDGKITEQALANVVARIPYNKNLKKTCYIISDLFVKQSGREKSLYGRLYKERKAYETAKNERGEYAAEAARSLSQKNYSKEIREIYEAGYLIPKHIDNRARRYCVKMFIAHLHAAMYWFEYGKDAPNPYPLEYMGHVDYIKPEVDYHDPKFLE